MTAVPHFDMPFRFGTGGVHAAVVEQNSIKDVTNCVEACLRTTKGTRYYVPQFGITDPTFQTKPLPQLTLDRMQQEVQLNEPRATTYFIDLGSAMDPLIANIVAEVNNSV